MLLTWLLLLHAATVAATQAECVPHAYANEALSSRMADMRVAVHALAGPGQRHHAGQSIQYPGCCRKIGR